MKLFFIHKNPVLNLSQWQTESGFTSHLILLARVSSFLQLPASTHFSLPPWKTRLTYTKFTPKIFLLQLCIQYLFCGRVELLSAMLSAIHLSWSLTKKKQKEVNKRPYFFLVKPSIFRTALSSLLRIAVMYLLCEESQPLVWETPKGVAQLPFPELSTGQAVQLPPTRWLSQDCHFVLWTFNSC